MLKILNAFVGGESDLPAILLGIVVAYLTILISVAIAIFSEEKEFDVLDRNVILDHIIEAKRLLLYLGLSLIPLIFWNSSLLITRLLEITLWIIGIYFFTNILFNSYHWMKGNKFKLRFDYLKNLQNTQDMEEAWRSVWQTKNTNSQNEQEFFNIFYSTVNGLFESNEQDNLIIASKLLSDFNNFIDKRSSDFLTLSDNIHDGLLRWHFELWKKRNECLDHNKTDYIILSKTMDSVFRQIEIHSLKEKEAFIFFDKLKVHVEKCIKESVSSSYIKYLFDIFYQEFFQNIYDAPDKSDIWEVYFPEEWKITKNNLLNTENIISRISLNKFLYWANRRILQSKKEFDLPLDDVLKNLFPYVDPALWAKILIFIFSPYGENQIRSVIERPWNFGIMSRVYIGDEKIEIGSILQYEETETFSLSCLIFKEKFSISNLENYIQSLDELSYPVKSEKEEKRLELRHLFSNMLEYVKSTDNKSP